MNKLFSKNTFKNIAIASLIAIFFIIDRLLKLSALSGSFAPPIKLIGDFFSFGFTANYYIAFSIPITGWILNSAIFLIIVTLIYYIFYLILNKKNQRLNVILLTTILFGAISNILDRLIYGYVIDYLELRYFTVFNLADVMISLSVLILLFTLKRRPV